MQHPTVRRAHFGGGSGGCSRSPPVPAGFYEGSCVLEKARAARSPTHRLHCCTHSRAQQLRPPRRYRLLNQPPWPPLRPSYNSHEKPKPLANSTCEQAVGSSGKANPRRSVPEHSYFQPSYPDATCLASKKGGVHMNHPAKSHATGRDGVTYSYSLKGFQPLRLERVPKHQAHARGLPSATSTPNACQSGN